MGQSIPIAVIGLTALVVFGACRIRFVGGCDEFAYYAQGELFLGHDRWLHGYANPFRHAALTPHGMSLTRHGFASVFPAGYSVLLAIAGLVDGQYWVDPILASLSIVLLFAAAQRDAPRPIAFSMAVLWGTLPLVAVSATDVMSDMAAATAILGSYLLLRNQRIREGGMLFGLSLMIRPMNLLFLASAVLLVPKRGRRSLEFAGSFATGAIVSLGVQFYAWGQLLSPIYRHNLESFAIGNVGAQIPVYAREMLFELGPVLALAVVEVVRAPRQSMPELAWFGAFTLGYLLAGPFSTQWTISRFLLPAYPAILLLAARAATDLLWRLNRVSERTVRLGSAAIVSASLTWGAFGVAHSTTLGILEVHAERDYESERIGTHVPPNALIGSLGYSGALRLYAGLETFSWVHPDALAFALAEYGRGRPLYFLIEPAQLAAGPEDALASRFASAFVLVDDLKLGNGYVLQKVVGVRHS